MRLKDVAEVLKRNESITLRLSGNSMHPIIKHRQLVRIDPLRETDVLEKGSLVFCKIKGRYIEHKISAIKGDLYEISNNHGFVNGTCRREAIFGIITPL